MHHPGQVAEKAADASLLEALPHVSLHARSLMNSRVRASEEGMSQRQRQGSGERTRRERWKDGKQNKK